MDIRGLPLATQLVARTPAAAAMPQGFTAGHDYPVVSLGIDCLPAQPVIYALVLDDLGALHAIQSGPAFVFVSPSFANAATPPA